MVNKLEKARELLKKYNQDNILRLLEIVRDTKKEEIIDKILSIDFEEIQELYQKTKEPLYMEHENLEPMTALNAEKLPQEIIDNYINAGESILINNKFAVATMAGGQGTRFRK